MKNNTLKKIGLMILAAGLVLGFMPKEGVAAAPYPPTDLVVTKLTYGNHPGSNAVDVDLAWTDNSSDERCFKIYQSLDSGVTWSNPYNYVPTNWPKFTVIAAPGTILYKVCAESYSYELSGFSNVCTVNITGNPSPTLNASLGSGGNWVYLTWTDNYTNETGFEVWRSTDNSNFSKLTNTNITSYSDMNIVSHTKYYYKVRATLNSGYSDFSNVVSATTQTQPCKKIVYVHGAGEFRPWKGCAGPCFEIKTFVWGRSSKKPKYADAGQKELPAFGDELNQYMIDNNIFDGSEVTILAHSFGNLIVRQAMIRAWDQKLTKPGTTQPLYGGVHFVQVAPVIGGEHWASSPYNVAALFSTEAGNMNPDGGIQEDLYDDAARTKLKEEIGAGKIDIVLAGADTSAPPARRQLFNKWLAVGLKEVQNGAPAPIVMNGKTHNDVLDSSEVCALVTGQGEIPLAKPAIFVKDAKTTLSGKLILTLYNVGAPAKNVRATAEPGSLISDISITMNTSNFGDLGTGEIRDNSGDPFTITIPFGTPQWFFAPEIKFTITYDGSPSPPDIRTCHVVIKPLTVSNQRILSSNSLLPWTINFAKKLFERILSLAGDIAIAQESPSGMQQLNAQPVLADLDKDGKKEVIIPLAGRKLYVLKSDGTDFWPAPYIITDSGCTALYPVAADINNDGNLEIIIAEYGADVLRILDKNGDLKHFVSGSGIKVGMPAVADIDNSGDGKMEIVVAKDGVVSLINSEGGIPWSKEGFIGYTPATSAPVLVDLDGNGTKEIIIGDVCVLDKDGYILSKKTALGERGASVADIDNDGKPEIITGRIFKFAGNNPADILIQWLTLYEYIPEYPPQIADLDGDGELEVLTIEESGDLKIHYDIFQSGSKTAEFSLPFFVLQRSPIALCDMDKDGNLEIVAAANSVSTGALYLLGFLDSQVELIDTFDADYKITHTPVIADMNKDGIIELVAADLASESGNQLNYFSIGDSSQGAILWPQFQRDTLRTGLYDIQPPQLSAIGNKTVNGGRSLSFTISATDQLVGKLNFSVYPLPEGAKLINNGNGTATFSWTPAYSQAGSRSLTFIVGDGALTSSETISTTVNPLAAPTCLVSSVASASEATLMWQDNSANETGFKVERSTDGVSYNSFLLGPSQYDHHSGPEYRAGCNSSGTSCWSDAVGCIATCCGPVYNFVTYVDRGLDFGRKYYYRIRATINGSVDSDYSNVTSANTSDPGVIQFGFAGTIPVPGDYDGDGKADLAVYYPPTGSWYIRTVSGAVLAWGAQWGTKSMIPVPGDYDGDRKADLALFDTASSKWYIKSLFNATPIAWGVPWGFSGTKPISGDYDGDGKADLAIYHPSANNWYIRTIAGAVLAYPVKFGTGIQPLAADFNGDGKAELVVYDSSKGNWHIKTLGAR
jgi:hypothetical protein